LFSDGGRYVDSAAAIDHGLALIAHGADMLDIGGESTRPGARPLSVAAEIARVVPVVDALARSTSIPISVDTSRPAVMRAARPPVRVSSMMFAHCAIPARWRRRPN
jgi:dihydropteroate synthase